MVRHLTPHSSLENLKREAKRWLKALRAHDTAARARLEQSLPNAPPDPGLRDVQHALALEHGLPGWSALVTALEGQDRASVQHAESVAQFLVNACPDWRIGGRARRSMAQQAALRILARHPAIAHDSIYTAVVCGELEDVDRILAERPQAASEPGGARGWSPLLYLCNARIPLAAARDNGMAIARLLLDHGADPNAYYPGGDPAIHYTALCGVAGEGEEDGEPHPQRDAIARLLLERGAEPYDIQVLYNTHFHGDVVWLLELIYEYSVKRGRQADWADPNWSMLDMGGYGPGAHYLLGVAVRNNNLGLAEWVLAHGASPNATKSSHPKFKPQPTLHEEALRRGLTEMGDLLVRHGATPARHTLEGVELFAEACFRLDRAKATEI
jgi:hypothetical protein